jgi:hypothetical protein
MRKKETPMRSRSSNSLFVAILLAALLTPSVAPQAKAQKAAAMPQTYAEAKDFLTRHTRVIELKGEGDALIAVCPDFQGRIMTSTCAGPQGASQGWVNYDFITAGKHSPAFNNYGGEDRFWLGPEGGQFGLFFQLAMKQVVQNWYTPAELNTGAFRVESQDAGSCRLTRHVRVTNASAASFDLDVVRELRTLPIKRFGELFGDTAASQARNHDAHYVGFESVNSATNFGPTAWEMESGLVSLWSLGQFPAGEQTVIVVPYKPGSEQELGPVVQSDYFGSVPSDRLQVAPAVVLFRADGQFRAKLGVSAKRVRPFAGSVDLRTGVLTLVHFSLPKDPAADYYVNNTWEILQKKAYAGDVFNTYNDGPSEPGAKALGSFYELETLSPTRPLPKGGKLSHDHRTFHIQATPALLTKLVKETLGVEIEDLRKFLGK